MLAGTFGNGIVHTQVTQLGALCSLSFTMILCKKKISIIPPVCSSFTIAKPRVSRNSIYILSTFHFLLSSCTPFIITTPTSSLHLQAPTAQQLSKSKHLRAHPVCVGNTTGTTPCAVTPAPSSGPYVNGPIMGVISLIPTSRFQACAWTACVACNLAAAAATVGGCSSRISTGVADEPPCHFRLFRHFRVPWGRVGVRRSNQCLR